MNQVTIQILEKHSTQRMSENEESDEDQIFFSDDEDSDAENKSQNKDLCFKDISQLQKF